MIQIYFLRQTINITYLANETNQKRFNTLIQGRISAKKEARRQLLFRNNLEWKDLIKG